MAAARPWGRERLFMPEAVEKRVIGGDRGAVFFAIAVETL
jgi:hypothetical protein